jgi:hypothetical protein
MLLVSERASVHVSSDILTSVPRVKYIACSQVISLPNSICRDQLRSRLLIDVVQLDRDLHGRGNSNMWLEISVR